MPGFFSTVSRYVRPTRIRQEENRLTQVLAGVLESSPELALALARDWCQHVDGDSVDVPIVRARLAERPPLRSVRAQRPTGSGGWVDLELRFGDAGQSTLDDVVVWIEVKLDADLHGTHASRGIDNCWRGRLDCGPDFKVGFWATHSVTPGSSDAEAWSPLWCEWMLRASDIAVPGPHRGVPVFAAGLSADKRDRIVAPEASDWSASLAEKCDFVDFSEGRRNRFMRVAYPEEVLVGRTLEAQGEKLAKWVLETFRAVRDAGPPPGR